MTDELDKLDEMENDPYGRYILDNWHQIPRWLQVKIYLTVAWYTFRRWTWESWIDWSCGQ
jgi:hypothetical protein